MALHFYFKRIEATEALKEHIEEKVEKFEKYVNYPMEVHVYLSVEKEVQKAEIKCHAEHRDLVASAESEDLYGSIDAAVHKIESQLKKEREKKKGHTAATKVARKGAEKLAQDLAADIPHLEKKQRVRS